MPTYMHAYILTYIHTYLHTHTCTHAYLHTHIHTYIHRHTYTYRYAHAHVHIVCICIYIQQFAKLDVYVYAYTYVSACIYMHISALMYICAYIYIHMYVCMSVCACGCTHTSRWCVCVKACMSPKLHIFMCNDAYKIEMLLHAYCCFSMSCRKALAFFLTEAWQWGAGKHNMCNQMCWWFIPMGPAGYTCLMTDTMAYWEIVLLTLAQAGNRARKTEHCLALMVA